MFATTSISTTKTPATKLALFSWALFDWAAQPFFTLVCGFLFAPYFASVIMGDPVTGQVVWGYAVAASGAAVALGAPFVGAVADASGRRKPALALSGAVFTVACALLVIGEPGQSWRIAVTLFGFGLACVMMEFAVLFNNAMLPALVPVNRIGRLSGQGAALGNLGGIVSIVLALGFLTANPETGLTLLGREPILGLDGTQREGERAIGPLAALWFVIFLIPLFLFTPDTPAHRPVRQSVRQGLGTLASTLRQLPRHRNVMRFLLANMVYSDGLAVLFAFGGIFATGIMDWTPQHVGIFGIVTTLTGIAGAYGGGILIDRFGAKAVILSGLLLISMALSVLLATGPAHIGPFELAAPQPGRAMFASVAEGIYLLAGCVIGIGVGALLASRRVMLIQLSPPDRIGQFLGLYTLSGKITAFIGPLAVAMATQTFGTQRAGIVVLIGFLLVGGVLLVGVRPGWQGSSTPAMRNTPPG